MSDDQTRKDAFRALMKILAADIAVIAVVIVVYLKTSSHVLFAAGAALWALIFGAMFYQWFRKYGAAMKRTDQQESD
ncbi:MAG TPA: hypothetical protein VNH64_04600 [Parvularculaceae bacterium]|nr:hypothetical protein [Parvularculaceae bacterium]